MKQLYIKVTICFFFFWIFNSKRKINNLKIINTSKQISFIKVNSFIQFLFDILANWLLFRSLLLRFFLSFFFRISLRKRFFLFPFARCFLYPYKMIKIREGNFIFFFFFFSEITPSSFIIIRFARIRELYLSIPRSGAILSPIITWEYSNFMEELTTRPSSQGLIQQP